MSKQSRARAVQRTAPPNEPSTCFVRRGTLLAGIVVILAALAAYYNSFSGPFIADDVVSIANNPTITRLGSALSPPSRAGVGGRPLLNLTYALNYAVGGMNVWGYHAFNLLVHTLAGLTLFGLVRRTLLRPTLSKRFGKDAAPLALAVAAIWIVHPLQTEAVTFISQRAESLMGFFYLLTLYCFIRGVESTHQDSGDGRQETEVRNQRKQSELRSATPGSWLLNSVFWKLASVFSCLLGVLSKEIIVTAPVMVLLYDRTFVAGSFREAWRLRWRYYLGLASMWVLLACLMMDLNHRSVGFGQGITWWSYALTSCRSVVVYLKLAVWPHPLVFDYGTNTMVVQHAAEIVPYALVLAGLLTGTALALWRWPAMGFAGAWFFVILAPASSVVPVVLQPMAEYRMYLSLAAIIALVVLGFHALIGRRGLMVLAVAAAGLGWLSICRNHDYRSELAIWRDTVAKCPNNERAHNNLGIVLAHIPGGLAEAISHYETALHINPGFAETYNNLGDALLEVPGRLPEAIAQFKAALRIDPEYAVAYYNLGNAFAQSGRWPEAMAQYQAALRIDPGLASAHYNLGNVFARSGRFTDALGEYEITIQLKPDYAKAHNSLGNALLNVPGRLSDAVAQYEAAVRLDPGSAEAHYCLGNALLNLPGRSSDAMAEFETALRIDPDSVETHTNYGTVLLKTPGRLADAIAQLQAALRLKPDLAPAREILNQLQNRHGLEGAAPVDSSLHSNDIH